MFNTRTDNDGNFISTLSAGTKSIIKDTANNLAQNLVMEHKGNEKDLINKVGTAFGVDVNIRPDPVANTITIDTETGRRQTTSTTTSGGTWDEPRTTDTNFVVWVVIVHMVKSVVYQLKLVYIDKQIKS